MNINGMDAPEALPDRIYSAIYMRMRIIMDWREYRYGINVPKDDTYTQIRELRTM